MNTKTLNYVNALNDHDQFPGARCSQAENIYMYGQLNRLTKQTSQPGTGLLLI